VYVVGFGLRFIGDCDPRALASAVADIYSRHAILRVRFVGSASEPRQQVIPSIGFKLAATDYRAPELSSARIEAAQLVEGIITERFNLTEGEVFRAHLIKLSVEKSVLVLALHHIIVDGRSAEILWEEILERYMLHLRYNKVPKMEEERVFLDRLQLHEIGSDFVAELEWWRSHLADALRRMGLEGPQPRPPTQNMVGFRLTGYLESGIARQLRETANRLRVTPFLLSSCALHLLLMRETGQQTTLIGFPEPGRTSRTGWHALGPFVRMLIQRIDHAPDQTVGDFVHDARTEILNCLRHSNSRLDRLSELLGIERDLSVHPLFQVSLNYQGKEPEPVKVHQTTLHYEWIDTHAARFDLEFWLAEPPDGRIVVLLQANADIFPERRADALLQRYLRLLVGLAASEDEDRVADIDWLSKSEMDAAAAAAVGPPALTVRRHLGDLPTAGLARSGLVQAVREDEGGWTAEFVLNRGRLIADALCAAGIGPGCVVAVRMPWSGALVAALTAVSLADAVEPPMDPSEPLARARDQIRQIGAAIVVLAAKSDYPSDALPALLLEADGTPVVVLRTKGQNVALNGAYKMFTSGSTGYPKGVLVGHKALANRLEWMGAQHEIGERDTILHKTPAGFDVSLWELFLPLITGACLRVARSGGRRDPEYIASVINEGLTITHFVLRCWLHSQRVLDQVESFGAGSCPNDRNGGIQ
jgi:non-ribosomal peptide synthetase component F